ncbi:aspartyl/asparaginyl beta-hydroxylase domain-containing protein [Sphingomonas sp.]|uniref:aspartyl/asparaginyl beta-hydroxylase domain-containing protein n=1 Tax=Sphingomonas sp. TaxID=28214 RepID=UPI0017CAA5A3|nr:aspartyl/asparaginyl beta-hydroxylase domain-containing protein [Sphingomonas sp.]MBA3511724.1 aspartyl/asparaginyl beta-hydroxylase domain-containing protein [Sphingomonas sp.]
MRLTQPFVKLPIRFDADALAAEVNALPASSWVPHATGFPGNEAVRLVTPGGQPTDAFEGPMKPTANLARCPYIMEAMAELGGVWGRSRLMGLGVGAEVPEHVDSHYHWRTHLRIHVPVITNPAVEFTCGGETVHMAAGETWVFDSFRWHEVHNRGQERRVHLVLDTVVTERLWDLIDAAQNGTPAAARLLQPGERRADPLMFEQHNAPKVMSPWEIRGHIAFLAGEAQPHPALEQVMKRLDKFADAWASLWAQFADSEQGRAGYIDLARRSRRDIQALGADQVLLKNELDLAFVLDQLVFIMAVAAPATPPLRAAGGQRLAS